MPNLYRGILSRYPNLNPISLTSHIRNFMELIVRGTLITFLEKIAW